MMPSFPNSPARRATLMLLAASAVLPSLASAAGPGWGYAAVASPEHWQHLAPSCAAGPDSRQSPVDIPRALVAATPKHPLTFHYGPSLFDAENNGHAIELEPRGTDQYITMDGERFVLKQFHMHTPTEHHVDGAPHAMELHLVHANGAGALAVVGVFFDVGEENPQLRELLDKAPFALRRKDDDLTLKRPLDLTALLPTASPIAQYVGSLTTPPCTEGVHWNVFLTPLTISSEQLEALQGLHVLNARPLQPANGRWK